MNDLHVVLNRSDIGRVQVIGRVVGDGAVNRCSLSVASSRNISRSRGVDRDRDIRVAKSGVRKTIAELIDRGLVSSVETSVIDEDTFLELSLRSSATVVDLVEDIRTIRLTRLTKGERKLARGVDLAVKNIDNSIAGLLAGNTCPEDSGDVLVVVPERIISFQSCLKKGFEHTTHRLRQDRQCEGQR